VNQPPPPTSGARDAPEPAAPASARSGARALATRPVDGGGREGPAIGSVVAEKYRLERLLKSGGMGSVWVATHLGLQSRVAIKFMASRLGVDVSTGADAARDALEAARARFEREASAAAQIRMANVVQVLDYGVDGGMPYLVMELLEGEDLGARLARVGRLSIREASTILTAVARALQRAHDAGLVHRDLKPENIFLARDGDEEVPKVLDFGVAKALHGGEQRATGSTAEGTVVGTPHYISPEQAVGRTDIDHRSDLWSLGVIAFRMITGRTPFESELLLEVVVQICSAPIPQATAVSPDLPREVDAFMDRALAREPGGRFDSAKELAAAFGALVTAAPPRAGGRRSAWIALVAALALGALALAAWSATRSRDGADDARSAAPAPSAAPTGVAPALVATGEASAPPSGSPGAAPPVPASAAAATKPVPRPIPPAARGASPPPKPPVKPAKPAEGKDVGY
jgi:serine/threonine-protein kinase